MKYCKKCQQTKSLSEFYTAQSKCILCKKQDLKDWRIKNPGKHAAQTRRYRKRYPEKSKEIRQNVYLKRKDYYLTQNKIWRQNNKEKISYYHYNRKQNDLEYKLICNLRIRLNVALKHNQKSGSAVNDLGCSIKEFKLYIENQFEPGMSWDNHGEWHLDHVIPLSHFDLTNRMEFLEACNWLNIRPLWAVDNMRKGNRI